MSLSPLQESQGGSIDAVKEPRTRILFIFVDGVGLAPSGTDNPLSQVPMPYLDELLGGPMVLSGDQSDSVGGRSHAILAHNGLVLRAVDACLGVPGLPQSATGQTALFTGVNAPALVGDHITAFPTQRLK